MKRGKISSEEKTKIIELFVDDKSVEEIAVELDRSEAAISKVLTEIADEEEAQEVKEVEYTAEPVQEVEEFESEATQELKSRPRFTKTEGGRRGTAVAHQNSTEQVDKINKQVARAKKSHPAVYSIYKD